MAIKDARGIYLQFYALLQGHVVYQQAALEGDLIYSYPNGVPDETVKEWMCQRIALRKLAFEYAVTVVPEDLSELFIEAIAETLGTGY
jgi:hypothetical protein